MTHPYWTTLTFAVGLIALSLAAFLYCLTGWAWTKWRHATEMRQWAKSTRTDWDAEAEQLCAETERP